MKRECVAAEVSVAIQHLKRSLRPLLGSNFRSNFGRKWHFSDLPILPENVGWEGESGSGSDIAKPTRMTRTGHGVTTDKIVLAARPYRHNQAGGRQRFGLRPRMWSKPCLISAKRASIIGSNSRSVKIYGQSFSTPSR